MGLAELEEAGAVEGRGSLVAEVCCLCLWALVWDMPMESQPGMEVCSAVLGQEPQSLYKDWGTCICHSPSPLSSPSSPLSAIQNALSGLARWQIKD